MSNTTAPNGTPARVVAVCSATSPPPNKSAAATAPFHPRPVNTLRYRWFKVPARGDHVDDHGTGVRGGHKEDDNDNDGQRACDTGQGELLQEHEKGRGKILLNRFGNAAVAEKFDPQGRTAENANPDERNQDGNHQNAPDKFPNRSAVGNAADEHTDKGSPGDPPGPIKEGPSVLPLAARP